MWRWVGKSSVRSWVMRWGWGQTVCMYVWLYREPSTHTSEPGIVAFPAFQAQSPECHGFPRQRQTQLRSERKGQPFSHPQILPWFSQVTSPIPAIHLLPWGYVYMRLSQPSATLAQGVHDSQNFTQWVLLPPFSRRDIKWPPQGHRANIKIKRDSDHLVSSAISTGTRINPGVTRRENSSLILLLGKL